MTEHIPSEQLLPFLDGELPDWKRRRIVRHLKSCWACRTELARLQADIGLIVEAQSDAGQDAAAAPPCPWPGLAARLDALRAGENPESRASWFHLRLFAHPAFAGVMLVLGAVAVFLWLSRTAVSADEVLRRTSEADSRWMRPASGYFVRQKMRVVRADYRGGRSQVGELDSWTSSRGGYWRITAADSPASDLRDRYRRYGIAQTPLCANSFRSWSRHLRAGGRVSRSARTVDLRYDGPAEAGGVTLRNATLRVRPEDWHVAGMRLEFSDNVFDISEEDVSVLPSHSAPADVVAQLEPAAAVPVERALTVPSVPAVPVEPVPPSPAAVAAPNLDEVEMDVLYILHQLGADLGEPVTVSRAGDPAVAVQLWGVSPGRRDLIRRVLDGHPGVRLDLEPPPVPSALQAGAPVTLPAPAAADRILYAADQERLSRWFGGAQAKDDFGRSLLAIETDVLVRFYALAALATRWPPSSADALPPESRARLEAMVQDHAHAAQQRAAELRLLTRPLLQEFLHAGPTPPSPPSGDWREASLAGLEAAKQVDLLLRSQFTTSDTAAPLTEALAGFDRALAIAEGAVRGR